MGKFNLKAQLEELINIGFGVVLGAVIFGTIAWWYVPLSLIVAMIAHVIVEIVWL